MLYRLAADSVLAVHLVFIVFVVLGGLLALRYVWAAFVHLPAAGWGAFIELTGRICPLTTLENALRRAAGESGYSESFIEHYLLPVIYPSGLSRGIQLWLAALVLVVNAAVYAWVVYRYRSKAAHPSGRMVR